MWEAWEPVQMYAFWLKRVSDLGLWLIMSWDLSMYKIKVIIYQDIFWKA